MLLDGRFRCTRWRNIAIGSPFLWTRVSLPIHPKLFPLIAERSGNRRLTVQVSNTHHEDKHSQEVRIGNPLSDLASRIAHLEISWDRSDEKSRSLNDFLATHVDEVEFSSLRYLEVQSPDCQEESTCYLYMPALRRLVYNGDVKYRPGFTTFDLVHLRVEWFGMTSSDILDLLSECRQLEHCTISNDDPDVQDDQPPVRKVALHRIQDISIHSLCLSEAIHLFQCLELPLSTCVAVTIDRYWGAEENATFSSFLGPRIQPHNELVISGAGGQITYDLISNGSSAWSVSETICNDLQSLPILASYPHSLVNLGFENAKLPSLHQLVQTLTSWCFIRHISAIKMEEKDLEKLFAALEHDGATVCPHLESVDCTETKFKRSQLQHFLECRSAKGLRLQKLVTTRGFLDPDVEGLASLVGEHLEEDPLPPPPKRWWNSFFP